MESLVGLWDGPEHLPVLSLWGLPIHSTRQETVAKGALATGAHCAITPLCGVGTRGFCHGVAHTSWVLTPSPARDPPQPR